MRAFLAIELPDELRAELSREQAQLRTVSPGNRDIRWAAPGSLHLTLKFLGDVTPERVTAVVAALAALDPAESFAVEVRDFGFFPDAKRPRVFWAGIEAPQDLGNLARQIDTALASLGFAKESRAFTPHLTLARFRTPRADADLLKQVEDRQHMVFGRFNVEEYFLFESTLLPGGAEHKKVSRFPLR